MATKLTDNLLALFKKVGGHIKELRDETGELHDWYESLLTVDVTRQELEAMKASNSLVPGRLYFVTDEAMLAYATTPDTAHELTALDADTKLDKMTATFSDSMARAYVVTPTGQQTYLKVERQAFGNTIPFRGPSGRVEVMDPSGDYDATNKAYVDAKVSEAAFSNYYNAFEYGKTTAGFSPPPPASADDNYYDFTTNVIYDALPDLSGWQDRQGTVVPTNGLVIGITQEFWDLADAPHSRGTAKYAAADTRWDYFVDTISAPDNQTVEYNALGQLTVKVSADEGNMLEAALDGLYVPTPHVSNIPDVTLQPVPPYVEIFVLKADTVGETDEKRIFWDGAIIPDVCARLVDLETWQSGTADPMLSNLNSRAAMSETNITALQTVISQHSSTLQQHGQDISDNADNIATNATNVAALSQTAENHENRITVLETHMTSVEADMNMAKTKLDALTARIQALENATEEIWPIGSITSFSAPLTSDNPSFAKWLRCDGAEVDPAAYPEYADWWGKKGYNATPLKTPNIRHGGSVVNWGNGAIDPANPYRFTRGALAAHSHGLSGGTATAATNTSTHTHWTINASGNSVRTGGHTGAVSHTCLSSTALGSAALDFTDDGAHTHTLYGVTDSVNTYPTWPTRGPDEYDLFNSNGDVRGAGHFAFFYIRVKR